MQGAPQGRLNGPRPPAGATPGAAERAGRLLAWLLTQRLEGYEKSFKMSPQTLLHNRYLAGLPADRLPPARLFEICRELGMPDVFLARLQSDLSGADTIHFGFEEGSHSGIFKIYLEYWKRWNDARIKGDESILLHEAFKWDAQDGSKRTVANYTCFPRLSRQQVMQRIAGIYNCDTAHASYGFVKDLVRLAATRSNEQLMYLEVSEEGKPRASFDLNFHAAGLKLADIRHQVAKMFRHYAIPPAQLACLWGGVATKPLGHLSGGLSRDGQDFLTLYYDPLG
ncbi:MAG: hypothetical protein OEL20_19160 [Sulfuritalea sp.]|nr:hypothetical protein [Sulfuritalea sp.]